MPDSRRALGAFGEQAAAAYLLRQGWQIVARNWRIPGGELDLIARDGAALVFVEVRTRRGAPDGAAEESVTPAKQARLAALAYAYLDATATPEATEWRIDVVAVSVDRAGRIARIAHIRDAVEGR